jgi:hypothetical protein
MPETQREKYRASQRNYLENLPPEKIEFRKKYLQNYFRNLSEVQKQERSKYSKSYLKNNLHKHAAVQAKRRALKIMATPIWASKEIIDDYYLRATAWSKLSGEEFEVDHIVPLKSNVVCGLHCQQNLTILSRFENSSKGNRWWPDMPEPEPLK